MATVGAGNLKSTSTESTEFGGARAFWIEDAQHASSGVIVLAGSPEGTRCALFNPTDPNGDVKSKLRRDETLEETIARLRGSHPEGLRELRSLDATIAASEGGLGLGSRIAHALRGGGSSPVDMSGMEGVALPPRPESEWPREY